MKKSTKLDQIYTSGDYLPRGPRFGDIFKTEIVGIDEKGRGLGYLNVTVGPQKDEKKYTFAIRNGVPGDVVEIRVTNSNRKKREARIHELLVASPMRVRPECPHADPFAERSCGGCSLQSVDYDNQLSLKENFLKKMFENRNLEVVAFQPMMGMASPRYFRNKMEINFGESKQFDIGLGMHPPGYHYEVIDHETCLIGPKPMIEFIEKIREWAIESKLEVAKREEGTLQAVGLRIGFESVAIELIVSHELTEEQVSLFTNLVNSLFDNPTVAITILRAKRGTPTLRKSTHICGPSTWRETIVVRGKSYDFEVTPGAFFQTNSIQTGLLYESILDALDGLTDVTPGQSQATIWDLYCGSGTISCVLGSYFQNVVGIDIVPASIEDAARNATNNAVDGCKFICADAHEIFHQETVPDIIVVDPPRAGLSPKVIALICESNIHGMVYVSCNPKTLVRDLALFRESGFVIENVQPVDMFPHTFHMESVVRLRREKKA